jgi:transcriptional regulator with XRE-family HTH domain
MNYFKNIRIVAGISRLEASKELGISYEHLRNIENGQKEPGKPLILKMSKLYLCDTLRLLEESQKNLTAKYSKRVV